MERGGGRAPHLHGLVHRLAGDDSGGLHFRTGTILDEAFAQAGDVCGGGWDTTKRV